jgi:hypothetical protein
MKTTEKPLLYLNIRKTDRKWEDIECALCGKKHLDTYWQIGRITLSERAQKVCEACHEVLV